VGNQNRYAAAQVIEAIQRARGVKAVAARILECSRQTVDNYIERYVTVRAAYEEQRETLIDVAEGKLIKKLDEDEWAAIKFVLTTLGKSRGYTERQEITGAEGGPIEHEDVGLTDEKRIARLVAIFDTARTRRGGPADG
jgi:hypothetical protein